MIKLRKVVRKRELNPYVSFFLKNRKEMWPSDSLRRVVNDRANYKQIFEDFLKKKPLSFLKKRSLNTKKEQNVMFLGAGKGGYISSFKEFLTDSKIKASLDVFSLTQNLDPQIKKTVRNDYSSNLAFEELNRITTNNVVKRLQTEFLHRYDLIISSLGVAFHTNYPINAVFTSALMLKKGGVSYLQVNEKSALYDMFFNKNYNISKDPIFLAKKKEILQSLKERNITLEEYKKQIRSFFYYQKQIDNAEQIFQRFVDAYNKKNKTNLKYSFNRIETVSKSKYKHEGARVLYFEIKRIN